MLFTLAHTFMTATRMDGLGQAAAPVPATRPSHAPVLARLAAGFRRLAG